MKLFSLMDMSP